MPKLTRDQILAASDIRTEEVPVPEWGGSVLVRGLTGAQRDKFEAAIVEQRGKKQIWHLDDVRARMVVASVVDDQGNRLFTDEDITAVGQKSSAALGRVFNVAQRLAGLTKEDVEELAKN